MRAGSRADVDAVTGARCASRRLPVRFVTLQYAPGSDRFYAEAWRLRRDAAESCLTSCYQRGGMRGRNMARAVRDILPSVRPIAFANRQRVKAGRKGRRLQCIGVEVMRPAVLAESAVRVCAVRACALVMHASKGLPQKREGCGR